MYTLLAGRMVNTSVRWAPTVALSCGPVYTRWRHLHIGMSDLVARRNANHGQTWNHWQINIDIEQIKLVLDPTARSYRTLNEYKDPSGRRLIFIQVFFP